MLLTCTPQPADLSCLLEIQAPVIPGASSTTATGVQFRVGLVYREVRGRDDVLSAVGVYNTHDRSYLELESGAAFRVALAMMVVALRTVSRREISVEARAMVGRLLEYDRMRLSLFGQLLSRAARKAGKEFAK